MTVYLVQAYCGNEGFEEVGCYSRPEAAAEAFRDWLADDPETADDFKADPLSDTSRVPTFEALREWLNEGGYAWEAQVVELPDLTFTPEGSGMDYPKFCRHGREGATYWEVSPGVFNVLSGGAGYADLEGLMRLRGDIA